MTISTKINLINDEVLTEESNLTTIGLHSGLSGHLLFHSYHYLYSRNYNSKRRLTAIYNQILEKLRFEEISSFLDDGLSGFALSHSMMNDLGLRSIRINELIPDLGSYLEEAIFDSFNNKNFDFLRGATGNLWYLVVTDSINDADLNKLLSKYIELIQELIKDHSHEITVGYAHGFAAVVTLFLTIYNRVTDKNLLFKLKSQIDEIIYLIFDSKKKSDFEFSLYPIRINRNKDSSFDHERTRLSWCHGDLPIAIVLLKYGLAFQDQVILSEALRIADFSIQRTDHKANQIYDSNICHGTASISLLFYRLYNLTSDWKFYLAYNLWKDKTMLYSLFDDSMSGFKAWDGEDSFLKDQTFLNGIAGIGSYLIYTEIDDKKAYFNHLTKSLLL